MSTRPLRQFYDGELAFEAPGDPAMVVNPWLRHRARFIGSLRGLSEEQWRATTRCDEWDTFGVLWHLITADQFWIASIGGGVAGAPTRFLEGFDPTSTPGAIADAARRDSRDETLEAMATVDAAFRAAVDSLESAQWEQPAEVPFGHVPARVALAHAFWDSWLHERDILVPLGLDPVVEPDELWAATWYSLVAALVQGGLPGDPVPVGPGATEPFDAVVVFDEFPGRSLRLAVDSGVTVTEVSGGGASAGSALDLVEYFTGRTASASVELPEPLSEHLERARQVL